MSGTRERTEEDTFLKLKQIPFKEAKVLYHKWLTHPDMTVVELQLQLRNVGWKWREFMDHEDFLND